MAANRCEARPPAPAFDLKGTVTPVTVLHLRTTDLDAIEAELVARIEPMPQLFLNASILIDVGELTAPIALGGLSERLRQKRLIPVGVANLAPEQLPLAAEAGLAVVQLPAGRVRTTEPGGSRLRVLASDEARAPRATLPAAPMATLTITQPIRGGQVVYAQRADVVVLAPVNAGAQVIADGHVHVYGALRGRALAGAQGMVDARVFCQSLEAELVSIAGHYLLADEIPVERRSRPSQLFLEEGGFRIVPL